MLRNFTPYRKLTCYLPRLRDLGHVKSRLQAARGVGGKNTDRHGKDAQHLVVEVTSTILPPLLSPPQVPVGTVLRNPQGEVVADLVNEGTSFVAARGGAGGKGNAHFKTSVRKTPMIAEAGGQGEQWEYTLELRTMADIGLIGFPNAGKSTLLTAISRARPKVAAYPFTTLNPHIGMVQYDDLTQLAVADLPGLLPDAHKNHGLGISFLRHVERCSVLVFVLDLGQEEPWYQLDQLRRELELYSPGLAERPSAVIANKMDLEGGWERFLELQSRLGHEVEVIPTSGKMGLNLTNLLVKIKKMKEDYIEEE